MRRASIGINGWNSKVKALSRLRASALSLSVMLGSSCLAKAQGNPQQNEAIQVSVDRVNVGVIVTDHNGHFVEGLQREDFRIFDNGTEQPIAGFAAMEEPGQVLMLVEAGPAVYLLENGHTWAADALLRGLSADDRVAVVKYADAPAKLLDFTADKSAALAALGQLRFNLGFGSLNLSSSVLKVLGGLASVQGKKSIVLLSTGVDTSSANEIALLLQSLRACDVRLLAVSLAGGLRSARAGGKKKSAVKDSGETTQELEQASLLLRKMSEATGGRAYFPSSEKEFDAAYREIAQLIRHEYSLAFVPPARDGEVHNIEIRVNWAQTGTANKQTASVRVDHRQAYLAPQNK